MSKASVVNQGDWAQVSESASMSIPVATVNMEKLPSGRAVSMVFLGLGIFHDYYVNLIMGAENTGTVIVEDMDGREERYDAEFVRIDEMGRVYQNIVIAGFDPDDEATESIGWLNIGYAPVGAALSAGDRLRRFSSTEQAVTKMIETKTEEKRKELEAMLQQEPSP